MCDDDDDNPLQINRGKKEKERALCTSKARLVKETKVA
jgi:hypothetical protein